MTSTTAPPTHHNCPGRFRITTILITLFAWYLLLNFSKAPLIPSLEPSWMAGLAYAATQKLQFGRDVIFTYGPLSHLVFSPYISALYTIDHILEIFLKTTYVITMVVLAHSMRPWRRWCFLLAGFVAGVLSYQTLYLFTIVCFAFCLTRRSRVDIILLLPLFFFIALAALIKLTFLWAVVLVLLCTSVLAFAQHRIVWALAPVLIFAALVLLLWRLAGQKFSTLPDFWRNGFEVTAGYSATMSQSPSYLILSCGFLVGVAVFLQIAVFTLHARRAPSLSMAAINLGVLFLAWKLAFTRADGHVALFFYYSAVAAVGMPMFFPAKLSRMNQWLELLAMMTVATIGGVLIVSRTADPNVNFGPIIRERWTSNFSALLYPRANQRKLLQANLDNSERFCLPRVQQTVGRASVDVIGVEQAIALLNGLNYKPNPSLQSYCDYTPRLAQLNTAFYRSSQAPAYVIFKLQTTDNRLPTIDYAKVLLTLAHDYDALFAEGGYLLFKRNEAATPVNERRFKPISTIQTKIGDAINVPAERVWCELSMRPTRLGSLLSFFYQAPAVSVELKMATGENIRRRILPTLATNGFILSPMSFTENDFVGFMAAKPHPSTIIRQIRIVADTNAHLYNSTVKVGFFSIPPPAETKPALLRLLRELRGHADVLGTPATEIKSNRPLMNFDLAGHRFLLVHPTSELHFDVPNDTMRVTGDFAMNEQAYTIGKTDGAEFQVTLVPSDSGLPTTTLFRHVLDPSTVARDRGIQHFEVDLPKGARGQLVLRTLPGPSGNVEWDWTGWSNIRFHGGSSSDEVQPKN